MNTDMDSTSVRVLCRKLVTSKDEPALVWLIGSPFLPSFTVVSALRCIHTLSSDPLSPDFPKESHDIRTLLLKGLEVIGALIVGNHSSFDQTASEALEAASKLRKMCGNFSGETVENQGLIGAVLNSRSSDIKFFVARHGKKSEIAPVSSVAYEDEPEKYVWERGCILQCGLPIKLPIYYPANNHKDVDDLYLHAIEAVVAKLRDTRVTFMVETLNELSTEAPEPVILHGEELEFQAGLRNASILNQSGGESDGKTAMCSYFCSRTTNRTAFTSIEENADKIRVKLLYNGSRNSLKPTAPVAEYFPALEEAKILVVDHKLEVLCYAAKDLLLTYVVSKLIIPALIEQLHAMKNMILPNLLKQCPQLHPYHFCPPGFVHPITVIYELSYGEMEMKQVEVRKSLHLRMGLPFDRPLLRVVNSMNLSTAKDSARIDSIRRGSSLLKDVHIGIPSSGVSGGIVSLIQGSYEYYHYLQDGFDDSGWGCAYRSLQTIISWFRLQHYTSIDVPSHREIQQSLVQIGDKDPSFIGSREWIGAIELSFVLDKLLGVSCKVINVRSGAELPEKCRELALHFENQGTPIMIGGGVLAYTLLGVDYNDASGDCAFLILDPHYTGSDEHKKIVNGGWCGWKKAVDAKGKHFFLHNKFYNLLLPQRPNMV